MPEISLGEFEQTVLLAILARGVGAFALEVRREMEAESGRSVSRGAFYTTLERMKKKGLVTWVATQPVNARRKETQRLFSVTPRGMDALQMTQQHLQDRWRRLEEALGEP